MTISFNHIWPYLWSFGIIVLGCYCIWKQEVGLGIQGSPSIFKLDGITAIIIGLILVVIGFILLFNPNILR